MKKMKNYKHLNQTLASGYKSLAYDLNQMKNHMVWLNNQLSKLHSSDIASEAEQKLEKVIRLVYALMGIALLKEKDA